MGFRRFYCSAVAAVLIVILLLPILLFRTGFFLETAPAGAYSGEDRPSSAAGKDFYAWGLKRNTDGRPPEADPQGCALLRQYGGLYLGDTEKKTIYLTFDEGYENGYTGKILDVLRENNVRAIFFITGDYLKREPELVRRMIEEGHEVGNHTVSHPSLPTLSTDAIEKEILMLSGELYGKFGVTTRMLRPPKGEYSEKVLKTASNLSHTCVLWSFAYQDWLVDEQKGAEYAYQSVMPYLHNGAVLLLHAVSADNAAALDRIIKDAVAMGYRFGTAEELLLTAGETEAAGAADAASTAPAADAADAVRKESGAAA